MLTGFLDQPGVANAFADAAGRISVAVVSGDSFPALQAVLQGLQSDPDVQARRYRSSWTVPLQRF